MEPESPPLELSALEAEKEPMAPREEEEAKSGGVPPPQEPPGPDPGAPGGEKNGLVKLPVEEEEFGGAGRPQKFTGLGKEELLVAAAAPPWAKARTFLLLLFWLGWLGMLGAAAAIVARAPRCRPLPPQTWWQLGGLYRAPPKPFGGDLKGVAERMEHLAGLQVKGLVLGPLHPQTPPGGDPKTLPPLEELDPELGTLEDFGELVRAAKRKGLRVIVDLTPNPWGGPAWGGQEVVGNPEFLEKVKGAVGLWLERGAGGAFLDGIEELQPSFVAELRNLTEQEGPDGDPRVLVGGTRLRDPPSLRALLNSSGGGFIVGPFLEVLGDPPGPDLASQLLQFVNPQVHLGWRVGSPWQHLAGLSPPRAPQLLLLLWTLPGTPVLSYGDEVGLEDPPRDPQNTQLTPMPWEALENSTQAQALSLSLSLASLRTRERSLSLGGFHPLPAGAAAAFLRGWDQSPQFLVLLNPGAQPLPPQPLRDPRLPPQLTLHLSTHRPLPPDPRVHLDTLELLPHEGLLLSFPYQP